MSSPPPSRLFSALQEAASAAPSGGDSASLAVSFAGFGIGVEGSGTAVASLGGDDTGGGGGGVEVGDLPPRGEVTFGESFGGDVLFGPAFSSVLGAEAGYVKPLPTGKRHVVCLALINVAQHNLCGAVIGNTRRFWAILKSVCSTASHRKSANFLAGLLRSGPRSDYLFIPGPSGSGNLKGSSSYFCEPFLPADAIPKEKLVPLLQVYKPVAMWSSFMALYRNAAAMQGSGDPTSSTGSDAASAASDPESSPNSPDQRLILAMAHARRLMRTQIKQSSPASIVLKPIPATGADGSTRKVV